MATTISNYQHLDAVMRDLADIQHNSPGLALLFGERIKNFVQRNSIRINVLNTKRKEISSKHCLLDEKENPIIKPDENGVPRYCFIDDSHKEQFEKEMLDLYAISFELHI